LIPLHSLEPPVCVLGVGSELRGDDAAGVVAVRALAERSTLTCLEGGTAPENYLEKIVALAPATVVIIDAADWGGAPGDVRVFRAAEAGGGAISTHALSLDMIAVYLAERIGVEVMVVGIQPAGFGFGEPLSAPVRAAVERVAAALAAAG
jgi:hydrogenase 3 maturation protease